MKRLFSAIVLSLIISTNFAMALDAPVITNNNPNVGISVSKTIYNGNKSLLITIKKGKVPINAPARILKLWSDQNNNCKSLDLMQIAPGKYVTLEPVILEESTFTLKFLGTNKFKDINISFKSTKNIASNK